MTSWLNKQKKQTLLDLSAEAGLKQDSDERKDDLVENLDKYLQANATRLARNSSFQPYFDTRRTPGKVRPSSAGGATSDDGEVKSVVKARGRRTTKVKSETEDEETGDRSPVAQALAPITGATPARPRRRSQLLPASPADVTDDVEVAVRRFYSGLADAWDNFGIAEFTDNIRDKCSSVLAVQATWLALEAFGLQDKVLPRKYAFDIPSFHLGRYASTPSRAIRIPDLFQLLTANFWSMSFLWASTSIFIPLLFSYFYNLSVRDVKRHGSRVSVARYGFDPLIFNVVKAILAWTIYGQGYTFGIINKHTIYSVDAAMLGGHSLILIGSYVGIVVALYEAAQSK